MSTKKTPGGVAYVLRKFPVISETFILNEILALEERGVPVHIFSMERPNDPRYHEDLSKLKANITYLPHPFYLTKLFRHSLQTAKHYKGKYYKALGEALRQLNDPSQILRFLQGCYIANNLRRLNVSHIHSHFANHPTCAASFTSRITGIPFSFTAHAVDIFRRPINPKLLIRKMLNAEFVVTVSDYNKKYLEGLAKGHSEKIHRIYNGINLTKFIPNEDAKRKQRLFSILCISRLVEKKGIPILIEACRLLRDRNVPFECQIVGGGALQRTIEQQIKTAKLQDRVTLHGPCSHHEVLEKCQGADLFVLPCIEGSDGNKDGLPVSITEALACGVPVIATPVTGIPEIVSHGKNGLLVPENDAQALSEAIESVISNPLLHNTLRSNTRPSVEALFDIRNSNEKLKQLFLHGKP